MKRIALIVPILILLAPQVFAAGSGWHKTLAAAQKEAKASKQLIFVDLFAEWCGWCHKMEREVFPTEAFQKATDDMVLLRLDTEDRGEGTQFAMKYSITTLPTFMVLTPDMSIAGLIRGFSPAATFVKHIEQVRTNQREFEKLIASEPKIKKDYTKRFDLAKAHNQHMDFSKAETRFKALTAEKDVPADIRDRAYYELALTQVMLTRLDDATLTLKSFAKIRKTGENAEKAMLLQAQIYFQQGNLQGSVNELRLFKQRYPQSSLMQTVETMLPQIERSLPRK